MPGKRGDNARGQIDRSLARTDDFFEERVRGIIDCYIDRVGIEAPPAEDRTIRYEPTELTELNLLHAGISTIIWA